MKRFMSFLLVTAMLLGMAPAVFAADTQQETVPDETKEEAITTGVIAEAIAGDAEPDVLDEAAASSRIDETTQWKYLDDNTDPAGDSTADGYVRTSWTAADYDDSNWKSAAGSFGAQKGQLSYNGQTPNTLLEGSNGGNDHYAYFFRTQLQIDSPEDVTYLKGTIEYDDAMILYINGVKVADGNNVACDASGALTGGEITENLQYAGQNLGNPNSDSLVLTDLSMLHGGVNTVAVEIHQQRASSTDIWFNMELEVFTGPLPDVQTDISLSVGADESKMNFTWYAPDSEPGTVLIAREDELVDGQMPANAARFEAAAAEANDGNYSNQATAINLKAGTTYAYQLVNGEDFSAIYTFTTAESGAFSFAYVGDPQIGAGGNVTNDTNGWADTLEKMAANDIFSDISFMLSAGDQVNTASDENQYDGYLNHDVLLNLPVATVIGNHDSGSDAYNEHFNLANESAEYGTTAAGGDSYFVYNNVLFMVLNSNDQSAAEHKAFMEAAIAANPEVSWKIVTFHHSLYTVASHAYDSDILSRRETLVPIFTELDIDVVLMGHDHVYCRSYMMNGLVPMTDASIYDDENYSSITDPTGILYVTANSGSGSKTYNIKNEVFAYSAVQNQEHVANIAKVSVSDEQFTITTYRTTDMSVVDTFTINRTNPAWDVEDLIDAIGEVALDSEAAVVTAREAYDALTDEQKAMVDNYQDLLDAEHAITIAKAEAAQAAAQTAKQAAEEAADAAKDAHNEAETAKAAAQAAAAQTAEDKTAADRAAQIAEEAQRNAEAAQTAAKEAQAAAETAQAAAKESNVKAAEEAAKSAKAAAEATKNAADAAASAASAAEACQKAQEAQNAAEAAQKAAEDAAAKAEADREAAEKAEEEARIAEEAAKAAADEAQLALNKYNALAELDEYAAGLEGDEVAAAVKTGRENINAAQSDAQVATALEEAKAGVDAAVESEHSDENCPSAEYADVDETAWYHEAIDYVLSNGLMQGDGDNTFDPNQTLTRSMLVQIIYNMEGKPAYTAKSSFADVTEADWYYDAVVWATENGIVDGYGNGKFGPTDRITREQMVTIFWRYAGKPSAAAGKILFADAADVDAYAVDAVIWASENGVVNGVGGNKFNPTGSSTRAQAAQVIRNYCALVE